MNDWERRYRELYAAVWTLPPDEVNVSIEDVKGHIDAIEEAEKDARIAHSFKMAKMCLVPADPPMGIADAGHDRSIVQ